MNKSREVNIRQGGRTEAEKEEEEEEEEEDLGENEGILSNIPLNGEPSKRDKQKEREEGKNGRKVIENAPKTPLRLSLEDLPTREKSEFLFLNIACIIYI